MDFVTRLKKMKIQGATNIALESLKHLLSYSEKNGFGKNFDIECKRILEARPTAVVLKNVLASVKKNRQSMEKTIKDLSSAEDAAATNSKKLFNKKKTVMTHCHSSFVVAALKKNRSKLREVIVTETRPRLQGVITAKELLAAKIKVDFIVDDAAEDLMYKTDMVVVGADALRKEGLVNRGLVNKVGTHQMALIAWENKKPFYVITSTFAVDRRKKIKMEQRPAAEVARIKGAIIINPAFDITPWKYVTGIVTEKGIIKPGRLKW